MPDHVRLEGSETVYELARKEAYQLLRWDEISFAALERLSSKMNSKYYLKPGETESHEGRLNNY